MATPFKFGSEFLVNTTTLASQSQPSITGLADGRFVVSWTDESATGNDTSNSAIRAQIFNADGSMSGAEFLVNTTTSSFQLSSSITALDDGRFVVSWTDLSGSNGDFSGAAVRAQIFNGDGTMAGAEFLVNTTTSDDQDTATITGLANGGFVISWRDTSQTGGDTSLDAIRAQVYNADGTTLGAEFLVNTTTTSIQKDPSVTALADGRFVVSWVDLSGSGGDTSGFAVRAQIFDGDGTASGAEFLVNTTTFNSQTSPSVTALADGRFVVSWTDFSLSGGDTSSDAVRAQIFNGDGSPSGAEFLVNTTTAFIQDSSVITALADGRFVVSWRDTSSTGGDTSGSAVRAQVFNIDGSKAGSEFLVNSTISGNQLAPSITALADGRFVVSWTDNSASGGDTSNSAVRGQIFDPRETAVLLNGSLLDDDYVGTRYGDVMSGFIGDDKILGRAGDDDLFGEAGKDELRGNTGQDRLYGGDGNDKLVGGRGSDQLYGGEGNDKLIGGFGLDYHAGGAGNDTYTVDRTGDLVVENAGEGTDEVRSSVINLDLANYANVEDLRLTGAANLDLVGNGGANSLTGNDAKNKITGNGGADTIDGRGGKDILLGNGGADMLTGGMGRDKLTGGANADRFIFNAAAETGTTGTTRDKITDFSQAQGDRIDLSAIDAKSGGGNQAFSFIGTDAFSSTKGELQFVQNGGKTLVRGDIDGDGVKDFEIELSGLHTLTAGDFLL